MNLILAIFMTVQTIIGPPSKQHLLYQKKHLLLILCDYKCEVGCRSPVSGAVHHYCKYL